MDTDPVRILMVVEPADDPRATWTPVTDRFHARLGMEQFGAGQPWDGSRVMRALIVEQADEVCRICGEQFHSPG